MRSICLPFTVLLVCAAACGSDDGGDGDGDGDGDATPTAFRITTLNLRDPHTFALGSLDVTDTVDGLISDGITMDADDPADGNLDLSILAVFRPLDQSGSGSPFQVVFADCTVPADSTQCSPSPDADPVSTTADNDPASPCLEALADTTGGYDPPIASPAGPCFVSGPSTFDVALGDITLGMQDAQIAGTFVGSPAGQITTGLIRGFVTQETADMALIPDDVAVVGGMPVSSLLKDEDKDPGPGGADGWWFYLNFEAAQVSYTP